VKEEGFEKIMANHYDFVLDAIETFHQGCASGCGCQERTQGGKFHGVRGQTRSARIEIADISKSHHCKFAYIVRKYLHRQNVGKH
jgi:tRNA A37 threonylcarbamoyladenosine dehydratase